MKEILDQYGETILACVCSLIFILITIGLLDGPFNGLWENYFYRLFC